ncbi:VCBS repeat-containing protein [Archangium violaceum]|uniref:FG-GAP-like repeat-containing protein n=1 Tax=Archangium violaceum TaxID=83451 RepID=UPI001950222C|nr:FG-GAP-like repeat-containing protein [Archangium violaceum]QRN95989.1 VCBS repeat-containing protein [Archangium violaceum]
MNRVFRASLAFALLGTGCNLEEGPTELPPSVNPCSGLPPLTLTASPDRVHVNEPVTLTAAGGSGYYSFRVESGGSSGEMRGSRFVAGSTPATDTLVVEDIRCPGDARAQVNVVTGFDVAPARATVKPGTTFQVQVSGQLGTPVFTLERNATGSSTLSSTGTYKAGTAQGVDLVRVRDGRTGEEAVLQFEVRADAQLRGDPALMAVPAGSSAPLGTVGGSDRVVWTKVSGPGKIAHGAFSAEADAKGLAVLEAADPFTGQKARVSVRILDELKRDTQAHGRLSDVASVVTADFDGDGISDVAVGQAESDLARPQGGAVFIYKGSRDGVLPDKPTWTLTGETDTARFGETVVAGDLDNDGRAELAVSSPGADFTAGDAGAVYLYRFGANGPEPLRAPLAGLGRSGSFGAGLALADVDVDGDVDLVVGSPTGDLSGSVTLRRGVVDIYLLTPGEAVPELPSLRLGGLDLSKTGTTESRGNTELGRVLKVADLNGDGLPDVAALSRASRYNADGTSAMVQAVSVYFARASGTRFRESPDVYVMPTVANDTNGEGTWKLDVVPGEGTRPTLLMALADRVDSPDLRTSGGQVNMNDAGGALLFDVSAYKPMGEPAATPAQVKRDEAWARLYGDAAGINAGRSWAVLDVDGTPGPELLLGAPYASPGSGSTTLRLGGKVLVYPLSTLSRGAALNKSSSFLPGLAKSDVFGVGLATWPLPEGRSGLVAFAGRASAPGLGFTGRVDAFLKTGDSLAQWSRSVSMVPARPSVERFGEVVAVARGTTAAVALVGSPGFSGSGGANADGAELSIGRAWSFGQDGKFALAGEGSISSLAPGRNVGTDVAFTDFNGDGRQDAVIGAPGFIMPGTSTRATDITPVYQLERPECLPTASVQYGGVLVSLGQADGTFKPAYRLWAPGTIEGCTAVGNTGNCTRRSMGRGVLGGFDFNGDGKQDIAMLRTNGIDILPGRAPDDVSPGKLTMGCDPLYTAPTLILPGNPGQPPSLVQQTSAPAVLGDLNADGCDEVAWRYTDNAQRGGVVVAFGYDPAGVKCGTRKVPSTVRLAADSEVGMNFIGLGVATTRAGRVLGKTGADYLAVSAANVTYDGVTQPAVLLFDIAQLVSRRPASGETVVGAMDSALIPKVLVHRSRAVGFGTALAGGVDLTGDGAPELVVSAPGASVASDGGGAVFVYAGGPTTTGPVSPLLTLTGDVTERSNFGSDLALVAGSGSIPPTLVVGAPLSYRTGTQNGTAYLVPLGF